MRRFRNYTPGLSRSRLSTRSNYGNSLAFVLGGWWCGTPAIGIRPGVTRRRVLSIRRTGLYTGYASLTPDRGRCGATPVAA
jgi:hypothetical protein